MKIKLATYNIRLGKQQGLASIAGVIRDMDPDIVAIQEIGRFWTMGPEGDSAAVLAELLEFEFRHFITAIEEEGAQYGTAVFSKIDLGNPTIIHLPQNVDEPRKVAKFIFLVNSEKVTLFTTHLSWIEDRKEQIDVMMKHIQSTEGIVFLMGDLNEETSILEQAGLFDIMYDADPTATHTFPAEAPEARIDYICASHGTFSNTRIHTNAVASDHLCVSAEWESSEA